MTKEKSIYKIMEENGYAPIENRGIIVKYAPNNSLVSKFTNFFTLEYYVLQLCKDELVMIPIKPLNMGGVKEKIVLQLPYSAIQSVKVSEHKMNYEVVIVTDTDTISLVVQKEEWSEFRSSGSLATGLGFMNVGILGAATSDFKSMNWHGRNVNDTLSVLQNLKK